jgi:hypothetical protein
MSNEISIDIFLITRCRMKLYILFFFSLLLTGCFKNPENPELNTIMTGTSPTGITILTTVISDGGSDIFQKGICWSTHGTPTIADPFTNDGAGKLNFESVLTSFDTQKYYIRSYAVNGGGIGYSNELTYTFSIGGGDGDGDNDGDGNGSVNIVPAVQFNFPYYDSTTFKPGETIDISLFAYDPDGTIEKIEIYVNDALLTTLTGTFEYHWNGVAAGDYKVSAIAYDNDGGLGYSTEKEIVVMSGIIYNGVICDLIASENDDLVFGLNKSFNKLLFINPQNESLTEADLPYPQPVSMDYSYDDKKLYIGYKYSGVISIWDNESKSFTSFTFSASSDGRVVKVDSKHRRIYVLSDNGLFIIDMDSGDILLSNGAMEGQLMTLNTDDQTIFSANGLNSSGILYKYSVAGDVITLIQTKTDAGINTQGLAINPDMDYVVLPCGGGNGPNYNLYAFDTQNLDNIMGDFDIGIYPKYSAFTRDGEILLGLNGNPYDSYIYVMGAHSFSKIKKIYFPYLGDSFMIAANYSGSRIVASSYLNNNYDQAIIYFFDLR